MRTAILRTLRAEERDATARVLVILFPSDW